MNLVVLLGTPSAASDTGVEWGRDRTGVGKDILTTIRSAMRVESYLLAPELNFLHRDRPRLHSWPIVAHGKDADSSDVATLLSILEEATGDRCRHAPSHCSFDPAFGLRFRDTAPPVDVLVSFDCTRLCFMCGEVTKGEYGPSTSCDRDSLRAIFAGLFPHLRGSH